MTPREIVLKKAAQLPERCEAQRLWQPHYRRGGDAAGLGDLGRRAEGDDIGPHQADLDDAPEPAGQAYSIGEEEHTQIGEVLRDIHLHPFPSLPGLSANLAEKPVALGFAHPHLVTRLG